MDAVAAGEQTFPLVSGPALIDNSGGRLHVAGRHTSFATLSDELVVTSYGSGDASLLDFTYDSGTDTTWITSTPPRPTTPARPGDADLDNDFDQNDLVNVLLAGKYLTGAQATWGDGDWNGGPGGTIDIPPPGDGVFDQLDVISALNQNWCLTPMEFAALVPDGRFNDGMVSVVYYAATGEVAVDPPSGLEFTSINVDSASGIFPLNSCPGGAIDCDPDSNLFKATFDGSFGFFSFGNVATPFLTEQFLLSDLVVIGPFLGGGEFREADLVYVPVPEPSSVVLLTVAVLALGTDQRHAQALGVGPIPRGREVPTLGS